MKLDEILKKFVEEDKEEKERKIGRYWASEIYAIRRGYLRPENFFEKTEIDLEGVRMILTGLAYEHMLNEIFSKMRAKYSPQVKKEIQLNEEIVLVVKPDFVFPEFVIETKYPFSISRAGEIPLRYQDQLEAIYRAFEKKVYLGIFSAPFKVTLMPYKPSERRWESIKKILTAFHEQLKALQKVKQ
jgi:hypothetical protein